MTAPPPTVAEPDPPTVTPVGTHTVIDRHAIPAAPMLASASAAATGPSRSLLAVSDQMRSLHALTPITSILTSTTNVSGLPAMAAIPGRSLSSLALAPSSSSSSSSSVALTAPQVAFHVPQLTSTTTVTTVTSTPLRTALLPSPPTITTTTAPPPPPPVPSAVPLSTRNMAASASASTTTRVRTPESSSATIAANATMAPPPPAPSARGRAPKGDQRVPTRVPTSNPHISTATYSGIHVWEMRVNGIDLMRRCKDNWLNATQILKLANIEKANRTRILEREIQTGTHEKVQGGYGKYQGTWVPHQRGVEISDQFRVRRFLGPLIDFDPERDGEPMPTERTRRITPAAAAAAAARASAPTPPRNGAASARERASSATSSSSTSSSSGHHLHPLHVHPSPLRGGRSTPSDHDRIARLNGAMPPSPPPLPLADHGVSASELSSPPPPPPPMHDHDAPSPPTPRRKKRTAADGIGSVAPATKRARTTSATSVSSVAAGTAGSGRPRTVSTSAATARRASISPTAVARSMQWREELIHGLLERGELPRLLANPPPDMPLDLPLDEAGHSAMHWAAALARADCMYQLARTASDRAAAALITTASTAATSTAAPTAAAATTRLLSQRATDDDTTPLMWAVRFDDNFTHRSFRDVLAVVGDTGTLVADNRGQTVLHHIVAAAAADVPKRRAAEYYLTELMHRRGVPPAFTDAQDRNGDTALHLAARAGLTRIGQIFLDAGASRAVRNDRGMTADQVAEKRRRRAAVALLLPGAAAAAARTLDVDDDDDDDYDVIDDSHFRAAADLDDGDAMHVDMDDDDEDDDDAVLAAGRIRGRANALGDLDVRHRLASYHQHPATATATVTPNGINGLWPANATAPPPPLLGQFLRTPSELLAMQQQQRGAIPADVHVAYLVGRLVETHALMEGMYVVDARARDEDAMMLGVLLPPSLPPSTTTSSVTANGNGITPMTPPATTAAAPFMASEAAAMHALADSALALVSLQTIATPPAENRIATLLHHDDGQVVLPANEGDDTAMDVDLPRMRTEPASGIPSPASPAAPPASSMTAPALTALWPDLLRSVRQALVGLAGDLCNVAATGAPARPGSIPTPDVALAAVAASRVPSVASAVAEVVRAGHVLPAPALTRPPSPPSTGSSSSASSLCSAAAAPISVPPPLAPPVTAAVLDKYRTLVARCCGVSVDAVDPMLDELLEATGGTAIAITAATAPPATAAAQVSSLAAYLVPDLPPPLPSATKLD